MNVLRAIKIIGSNQKANLFKLLNHKPLTVPSLTSMTLDTDDLQIAREWLLKKEEWYNPNIVAQFETEFARWNGSQYAFAFMSGRVALSACIYALGLEPDDEVIIPGYTCVVVANAFQFAGIKVIYTDIELETYGVDVNKLEDKITPETRAILIHHLYGLVCRDYMPLISLARKYNLKIIEDCAQATGATFRGIKVGNFGDVAFYSSEQSKVFNTIQGGVAVTNDSQIAAKLREFYEQAPYPDASWIDKQLYNIILNYYQCKHPQRWWLGDVVEILYGDKRLISTTKDEEQGIRPPNYGCKMVAPIAAIALNQLKKIDHYNEKRRQTANKWKAWCENRGYKPPVCPADSQPIYLRYPVLVEPEKKQDTSWAFNELGIKLGVWFVSHLHPSPRKVEGCPAADVAVKQCINFPTLLD